MIYKKYVYDCLAIAKQEDMIHFILSIFDSFNTFLRFTSEIEMDGRFSFFNSLVIRLQNLQPPNELVQKKYSVI